MYRRPSARKRKSGTEKLNLTPILDAVFIFIFFLLMSASFIKVYEISSDVPMVSDSEPPKNDKPPLALTVEIYEQSLKFYTGLPSQLVKTFSKTSEGKFDYETIRSFLIALKQKNANEDTVIFEPKANVTYEELVEVMDAVRMLHDSDPPIYKKNKEGLEEKVKTLFGNIVFGDIAS